MESDLHIQYVKIRTYTEKIRIVTDMTDRYERPAHRYIRKKTQHYVPEGVCLYINVTDGIERYVVKYLNHMYSNLSVTT